MKIIIHKNKLINLLDKEKKLGFVPTMGSLHAGHISLVKKCISQCNKSIVTIFINKPQFNKINDYRKYPRSLRKDIKCLKKLKVNFLYIPLEKEIYPNGPNKKIKINSLSKKLCGRFRPGHFEAVVDVIDRFIKIINPKNIYLGEKDMQQLKIIEHFLKKNNKTTKVVKCKTIRNKSGIALSSRNALLSINEKIIASKIFKILKNNKRNIIKNKLNLTKVKKKIYKLGVSKIEYMKKINVNKLIKPYIKNNNYKIFISYYLGKTRLIDNI